MKTIGMILFKDMTQLDLTGPLEIFSRWPDTKIFLISKSMSPVKCDRCLTILPDTTFENCPTQLDILFVPGGNGISGVLNDDTYMDFIRERGSRAGYITSVCTGSIILAGCGLLDGFQATTHWLSLDLLKEFNVEVINNRTVVDRNRVTGGGVTSGIDFALTLTSLVFGEQLAKTLQLLVEYNPQPPFKSGHPDVADPLLVDKIRENRREAQQNRLNEIKRFVASRQ
jgi:cyclohexyl-isocyanide hydratase